MLIDLDCLKKRNILGIRFDRENKDTVLFAEKNDNLYRVIKLNYINNEEAVLFDFEWEIYHLCTFTENTIFWCERCEKNRGPHILYEYDSRTKRIKKLYEIEDVLKKSEERYESRFITSVQADDDTVYFYMDG